MNLYFHELKEQITNPMKWDSQRFQVFNHEAGTGKSLNTLKYIGELTRDHSYRVLYVQLFVKEESLKSTVHEINKAAGREVARSYDGNDAQSLARQNLAKDSQILCVSHNMYLSICSGNHQFLLKDRDILIIDEYPDIVKKISVSFEEVFKLWGRSHMFDSELIEPLAYKFKKIIERYDAKNEEYKRNVMKFIDFKDESYEVFKREILRIIPFISNKTNSTLLRKIQQILLNGCLLYEDGFHTFDNNFQFRLLNNNIILDANAGFDYKYSLSTVFSLRKQNLHYEYSDSNLHHINVRTGKNALSTNIDFPEKALNLIEPEKKQKLLLISDKDNQEVLKEKVEEYFLSISMSKEEIDRVFTNNLRIDYFGNITGVNTYREFDAVAIMKTPNFDYLTYALIYFYYSSLDGKKMNDVRIFEHEEIEKIRNSFVAGEIYQAIKRINRNNSKKSDIYIFTDNKETIDLVVEQLPNIKFKYSELDVNKVAKVRKESSYERNMNNVKKTLLDLKNNGKTSIRKKELRELVGVPDKGNFTKILKSLNTFLETNNFLNKGQNIIIM